MALNRIRLLNEEQLLNAIKDSGHEDIANILMNRGLNGQTFVEFQEIQTISWKLPRAQIRNLTSFINEVKANPTILIKGGGLVQHQLHKPKPSLLSTQKPSLPITQKPSLSSTQKPNLPSIPKRPTTLKFTNTASGTDNVGSGLLESETKAPNKTFDITHSTEQYGFKKKLATKLSSPETPTAFISSESNSRYSTTVTLQSSSVNDPVLKLPRPLIQRSMQTSDIKPKAFKPLPTEVHETRPKVIKFTPSETNMQTPKYVKERLALPLPRESESNVQSNDTQEEDYSDIDPKLDFEYLTPTDIESSSYPIPAANIFSKQMVVQNETNFLHSKFAKTIPVSSNNHVEEDSEDTYEAAPTIGSSLSQVNKSSLSAPLKEENSKISPMGTRRPMPLPTAQIQTLESMPHFPRPMDSSNNQKGLSNNSNKNEDSDEEMNIYDHVDENSKDVGHRTGPHSRSIKKEFQVNRQSGTSQQKRKCTVGELENIIIVDNEKDLQFKRSSNFFGTLGSLGKFFGNKNKSFTAETENPSNYENHMLLSEKRAIESTGNINKDRPLPEIPKIGNNSSIKRSSSSSSSKSSINTIEIKSKHQKFISERERNSEFSNSIKNRALPAIINDDDQELVYDDVQHNNHDEDDADLPEYENNETLNNTSNVQSSFQPILTDDLAFKLSEELKKRENKLNDKSSVENFLSKISLRNRKTEKVNKIPTPPSNEIDGEQRIYGNVDDMEDTNEENLPTCGNVKDIDQTKKIDEANTCNQIITCDQSDEEEEEYIDSIFNINQEPFYRETDRKGAKQLLRNFADGAFLFRPSEKYFLVLTIKFNKKFYNLGIERTTTNKIRLNADTSSVSPEFGTLKAFVNYFTTEALTFRDRETLLEIYLNPVLPADVF